MLWTLHLIIAAGYVILPALALVTALSLRAKRQRTAALSSVAVAFIAGLGVSIALNLVYATGTRGRPEISQMAIGCYVATAMILVLRMFDRAVLWSLRSLFHLHREDSTRLRGARIIAAALLRLCLIIALGLPYVMASVMIYRPRVLPLQDPRTQFGVDFERVEFHTSDGLRIVGWWIPAHDLPRRSSAHDEHWGLDTAIVCHGVTATKANQLALARRLVPGGYNVLAIDLRAHGESGGQIATFGALEKRDVLAAVRWLRQNRANKSRHIVGVGADMGAAALLAAGVDDSPDGHAIEAIACYACYDDVWDMTRSATKNYFAPPMDWLLLHVGLPIACAHSGADLVHYAPAREAASFWPRPLLFIHGQRDEVIDFSRGQALLDAASQPKYHIWLGTGSHNDIINDDAIAQIVVQFFRHAAPLPVI